ncbi:MAG: hypothetical protein WC522_05850 [Candidatus Omnitrophota bacterium]
MVRRIILPFKVAEPILACGADLKGAFAFAKGKEAVLVDGFGDLGALDNFTRYETAVKEYRKRLRINLKIVACDLHPGYLSTRFAENYTLSAKRYTLRKIQHHEAHIASAITDNNIEGRVIGVAFDGTGYGSDGNIWGGEFFAVSRSPLADRFDFKRVAHLDYIPMPGGERAVKEPWRMAVSYLYRAFGRRLPDIAQRWPKRRLAIMLKMIDGKINSPLTSSAGRLFDAVGSLVLNKDSVSREAELPVELERMADKDVENAYRLRGREILNPSGIIKKVVADVAKETGAPEIAAKFHNTIAALVCETSLKLSKKLKTKQVVLSGGVFQNIYLVGRIRDMLTANGLRVYFHAALPTNDSGIPIGQIAIANSVVRR